MTVDKRLAEEIEQEIRTCSLLPFPSSDLLKLKRIDRRNWASLHGALDVYFADVTGYASSAQRLHRRPRVDLAVARLTFSRSFFERHRLFEHYDRAITQEFTPDLFDQLETVENVRKRLVQLMDQILSEPVDS